TSFAAVGSSSSLTVAITPSSTSALITSPDLRRIFSASSPTVTDSGTRISSRLTSAGAGSASTAAAGSGAATPGGSGATGVGATAGATAAGATGRGATGVGGGGVGRGGGATDAGRDGERVTRGGANGPAGCRDGRGGAAGRSIGRNGTIFGSGFRGPAGAGAGATGGATVAAGLNTSGGGGATTTGSGTISGSGLGEGSAGSETPSGATGFGFTIVAAGLISAGPSSSVLALFARAGFFATVSSTATAASPPSLGSFAFATRLGFGASGRSRPLPSFTRSEFARALSRGLMARMPLCPISSAATIRSLLVTPSSLASSMTFILAGGTVPSPPSHSRCHHIGFSHVARVARAGVRRAPPGCLDGRGEIGARGAGLSKRVRKPATNHCSLDAPGGGTHATAAAGRPRRPAAHDTSA